MTAVPSDFDERKKKIYDRVAAILGGPHLFVIADALAVEELETACTAAENETAPELRAKLVNHAIANSQVSSFTRRARALNDKLAPHGRWISPTYLVAQEVTAIEALCAEMVTLEDRGDTDGASKLLDQITQALTRAAFNPVVRAFMNYRAWRLPHLSTIAHYLETATLLFYRQNYFATANTLLPAIERLLVSLTGFKLSDPAGPAELRTSDYKRALQSADMVSKQADLRPRFEAHRDEVLRFLFERFFVRSRDAEKRKLYDASVLNRAFALHLNEPGSYYTFEDCITYFQIFDLFTEFIAAQHGLELPGLIPNQKPPIASRIREYWRLILTDWLSGGSSPEKRIVQPTPFYIEESNHNYLSLHEGPELNAMLARAGLAIESTPAGQEAINPDRLALFNRAMFMYHSVVGA